MRSPNNGRVWFLQRSALLSQSLTDQLALFCSEGGVHLISSLPTIYEEIIQFIGKEVLQVFDK